MLPCVSKWSVIHVELLQVLANKQSIAIQARLAQQKTGRSLQANVADMLAEHGAAILTT